jgi:hypothetical protein
MITLLNGETWGKEEILAQMYDDEFYYGHLGKYALSSSSLKTILKSPKTYRNVIKYGDPSSGSPALSLGRLAHWMLLEPRKIDKIHFVDTSKKNTKIYKEAKENAKGAEVFLTKEKKDTERITDAVLRNEAALKLLSNSNFEVPEIGLLEGLPFRAKADIIKGDTIIDYKTSSDLRGFRYAADKYCYDLQAYLYLRLFNKKKFTFLVVDKGSTDIAIFEASEDFINKGKDKFYSAVENYKYFFQDNNDLDQYVMRGIL